MLAQNVGWKCRRVENAPVPILQRSAALLNSGETGRPNSSISPRSLIWRVTANRRQAPNTIAPAKELHFASQWQDLAAQ